MTSVDLYIVAAGNGSRINVNIPKALVSIAGEPCLTTTLRRIGAAFDRIFVVTNECASQQWHGYFHNLRLENPDIEKRIVNLPIKSGLGDGHATLQGLLHAHERNEVSDEVVITWGDVFFQHSEIIPELLEAQSRGSGLLPVIFEQEPYVSLIANDRMQCLSADFSKHGEQCQSGFHDQSIFRFSRSKLLSSLCSLHNCLWKNGKYITPAGELTFLYSLHQLYNAGDPAYIYETRYPTLSFNTAMEVAAVKRRLGLKPDICPVFDCALPRGSND